MPQKKSFGQISCTGSKVPFWQNEKIAKPVHEIQNLFLAKRLLLRLYESAIYKKYS
jgi:hypothetical protein